MTPSESIQFMQNEFSTYDPEIVDDIILKYGHDPIELHIKISKYFTMLCENETQPVEVTPL